MPTRQTRPLFPRVAPRPPEKRQNLYRAAGFQYTAHPAPIVQRIERSPPKRKIQVRFLFGALFLVGSLQLATQAWRGSLTYGADVRNPYAYAHTSSAIRRLVERVDGLAAAHPKGDRMHINIFRFDGDYWPLPWYLRRFPNVGYWPNFPETPDADLILTAPEFAGALQERLSGEYKIEMNGLRPGVLMPTFIRKELWDAYMVERSGA